MTVFRLRTLKTCTDSQSVESCGAPAGVGAARSLKGPVVWVSGSGKLRARLYANDDCDGGHTTFFEPEANSPVFNASKLVPINFNSSGRAWSSSRCHEP